MTGRPRVRISRPTHPDVVARLDGHCAVRSEAEDVVHSFGPVRLSPAPVMPRGVR